MLRFIQQLTFVGSYPIFQNSTRAQTLRTVHIYHVEKKRTPLQSPISVGLGPPLIFRKSENFAFQNESFPELENIKGNLDGQFLFIKPVR